MKNLKYYQALSKLINFVDGKPYWNCPRPNTTIKEGDLAGTVHKGYRRITIGISGSRVRILAHRLHWFMIYGELPPELDHIDRDKQNNRIENLRSVTRSENCFNKAKREGMTSKYKGVSWKKANNKWIAQIKINQKVKHIGSFDTQEEAYQARLEAERKLLA